MINNQLIKGVEFRRINILDLKGFEFENYLENRVRWSTE